MAEDRVRRKSPALSCGPHVPREVCQARVTAIPGHRAFCTNRVGSPPVTSEPRFVHVRRILMPRCRGHVAASLLVLVGMALPLRAANPTAEQALKLRPVQADVEYDTPTGESLKGCTISGGKVNGASGWVVRDPTGHLLRTFVDSNNDNVVDLWCYYRNGVEVYRDIDSNFNGKADQYRWLHSAGMRWGIDKDENGTIDEWKTISAEEVTAEVVKAAAQGDARRFGLLLLDNEELKALG